MITEYRVCALLERVFGRMFSAPRGAGLGLARGRREPSGLPVRGGDPLAQICIHQASAHREQFFQQVRFAQSRCSVFILFGAY